MWRVLVCVTLSKLANLSELPFPLRTLGVRSGLASGAGRLLQGTVDKWGLQLSISGKFFQEKTSPVQSRKGRELARHGGEEEYGAHGDMGTVAGRGQRWEGKTEEEQEAGDWWPGGLVCISEDPGLSPTGSRGGGFEGPEGGSVISDLQPV